MTRWISLLAACLSWTAPAMAQAPPNGTAFGAWTFGSFEKADNAGCVMSSWAVGVDGHVVMGLTKNMQINLLVGLSRASWSVPGKMPVSVKFVFASGSSYSLPGYGDGKSMAMSLAPGDTAGFVRDLSSGSGMTIVFKGTEKPWKMDTTGADRAIVAMERCAAEHGIVAAPIPLGTAVVNPTQPY